jgi:hypothetical protein
MSGNVNINRSGPEQMRDNPDATTRRENADRASDVRIVASTPLDWRNVAAHYAGIGVLLLVLALLYGVFRLALCWGAYSLTCDRWRGVETWSIPFAGAAVVLAFSIRGYYWMQAQAARVERQRVENKQLAIRNDRFGNLAPVTLFDGLTPEQQMSAYLRMLEMATELKARTAPHEWLPSGANTITITGPTTNTEVVDGQLVDSLDIGPIPIAEWMRRLDSADVPHAIFAAKTKGGKSTMAKAALAPRIEHGESIFVIDPHSNGWIDLPGVGGGQNWEEIKRAMKAVLTLYHARMMERDEHIKRTGDELPQDYFPRLTIIFDEANESRFYIEQGYTRKTSPWMEFGQILSSGARKVGISVWLICQSALVKNLGLSSTMLRNFSLFALDHMTIAELIEDQEPLKPRREAVLAAISGAQYPAATAINGRAYLLDRTGLDQAPTPRTARHCAWDEWDYDEGRSFLTPKKRSEDDMLVGLLAQPPRRYATQNGNGHAVAEMPPLRSVAERSAPEDGREALVKGMRRQKDIRGKPVMSQDAIRAALAAMGMEIAQDLLVRWCQEVDGE